MPSRAERLKEVDAMLQRRGVGRKCSKHKAPARIGILWADGRAIAFFCSKKCYLDWQDRTGEAACVVRLTWLVA